jgi:hypothetical protein
MSITSGAWWNTPSDRPWNLAWAMQYGAVATWRWAGNYHEMFEATVAGHFEFEVVDGDYRSTVKLARRREELEFPPHQDVHATFRRPSWPSAAAGL